MSKIKRKIINPGIAEPPQPSSIHKEVLALFCHRAFICPQCSHDKVLTAYNDKKNTIVCCCYKCSHWWSEVVTEETKCKNSIDLGQEERPIQIDSSSSFWKKILSYVFRHARRL